MMKKALLTLVTLAGISCSALAQGTITFANDNNSLVKLDGLPMPAPGYAQLFAAPAGTPFLPYWPTMPPAVFLAANPTWHFYGTPTPILPNAPGFFNGGTVTNTDIGAGAPMEAVVVAWQGNYSSFDAAAAAQALYGTSSAGHFQYTGNPLVAPGTPIPLTFVSMAGPELGIPEPGVVALVNLFIVVCFYSRTRSQKPAQREDAITS